MNKEEMRTGMETNRLIIDSVRKSDMEKCGITYDRFSEKELSYLGIERDLTYYYINRKR